MTYLISYLLAGAIIGLLAFKISIALRRDPNCYHYIDTLASQPSETNPDDLKDVHPGKVIRAYEIYCDDFGTHRITHYRVDQHSEWLDVTEDRPEARYLRDEYGNVHDALGSMSKFLSGGAA